MKRKQTQSAVTEESENVTRLDHKNEARRAWQAYQILAADRYLQRLEFQIETRLRDLDSFDSVGNTIPCTLFDIGMYQQEILADITYLQASAEWAKIRLADNLRRLGAGEAFTDLPLIDTELTLEAIESSVARELSIDVGLGSSMCISREGFSSNWSVDFLPQNENENPGSWSSSSVETSALLPGALSYEFEGHLPLVVKAPSTHDLDKIMHLLEPVANTGESSDSANHDLPGYSESIEYSLHNTQATQYHEETIEPIDSALGLDDMGQRQRNISECEAKSNESATWSEVAALDPDKEWQTVRKKPRNTSHSTDCLAFLESSVNTHQSGTRLSEKSTPMENSFYRGEEGQNRRKTQLCRLYQEGKCNWGSNCNYAHSQRELEAARMKLRKDKIDPSFVPPPTPAENPLFQGEEGKLRRKTALCRAFQEGACNHGEECNYAHNEEELRLAWKKIREHRADPSFTAPSTPMENRSFQGEEGELRRKTALCRAFPEGKCHWGEECNYAHSKKELRLAWKKIELYKSNHAPHTDGLRQDRRKEAAVKSSSGGSKAEHATSNATLKTLSHPEPCTRQHCPGRLAYETRLTKLCPSVTTQTKCRLVDCKMAHNNEELRPLPKYEMCSKYGGCGRCMPASECPYAHSRSEQRKRPTKTNKGSVETSGEEKEECLICYSILEQRTALPCGHSQYHHECISKWLKEGRPNCPLCDSQAFIPQASAI